ncbi:hypothetical protein K2P97_10975 [bacterium]|nr:hypothetical protein [bacterium]
MKIVIPALLLVSSIALAEIDYDARYSYGQPVACGNKGVSVRPFQPPLIDVPSGERGAVQALGIRKYSAYLNEQTSMLQINIGMSMSSCVKDPETGNEYFFSEEADPQDYLLLMAYHSIFSDARFRQSFTQMNHVNMDTGAVRSISTAVMNIPLHEFLGKKIMRKFEQGESVTVKMSAHYAFKNFESPKRAYFPYFSPTTARMLGNPVKPYEEDLKGAYLYGASHGLSITIKKDAGVIEFKRN